MMWSVSAIVFHSWAFDDQQNSFDVNVLGYVKADVGLILKATHAEISLKMPYSLYFISLFPPPDWNPFCPAVPVVLGGEHVLGCSGGLAGCLQVRVSPQDQTTFRGHL